MPPPPSSAAPPAPLSPPRGLLALALAWAAGLVASGIAPYDRLTWVLEVAPVLIALPVVWATRRAFPLTPLLYALIALHGLILILGGAYTYARVPFGFWLQELFGFARNPYDRIGHIAQGFVPALVARELLVRAFRLPARGLVAFLSITVALAISAGYELVEWAAALILGQGAEEFLGTQGDPWDTQADMACALAGAMVALLSLARIHDRQMAALDAPPRR